MGYDGFHPNARRILDGNFPTTNLPEHTAQHIQELSTPYNLPPWPDHLLQITPSEHEHAWRKAKECTSSSPSGLHFGPWKANARNPILCELDSILRAIPFQTGYSMRRWQTGIDVELQKEPGNFNIERMRTIVLREADHNLNNKLLGRRASYGIWRATPSSGTGTVRQLKTSQLFTSYCQQPTHLRYHATNTSWRGYLLKQCRIMLRSNRTLCSQPKPSKTRSTHPTNTINAYYDPKHAPQPRSKWHTGSPCKQGYNKPPVQPPLQGMIQGHGTAPTGWLGDD